MFTLVNGHSYLNFWIFEWWRDYYNYWGRGGVWQSRESLNLKGADKVANPSIWNPNAITVKGHSLVLKKWNWHFFHFWHVFASAGFEPVTLKNQTNEYFLYHIQGFKYRTPKNMQNMKKFQIWVFHHWTIPKWVTFTNFGEICSKIEPVTEKSALQKNMAVASLKKKKSLKLLDFSDTISYVHIRSMYLLTW